LAENDGEQSEASDEDKTAAPETASAAPVSSQKTQDTLLFECLSNTCGVSLKGFDTKMHYFTKTASRYINHNDTVQITITVPIRTKLLMNGSKLEYGKYNNTLLFHKGNIISKSNRDLR
ncbi:MAG: hypothetical protein FWC26_02815, partial [Fibromonadales bacterium]|nr:hypothetical protein [Fibromonadales bacterium]